MINITWMKCNQDSGLEDLLTVITEGGQRLILVAIHGNLYKPIMQSELRTCKVDREWSELDETKN